MGKNLLKKLFTSIKNDDLTEAVLDIDRLIRKNPSKPNNYIKKGDIYRRLDKNTEAVNAYQKAADLSEDQGFLKTTLAIYKLILRVDPGNTVAFNNSEKVISDLNQQMKTFTIPATPPEIKGTYQQKDNKISQDKAFTEPDIIPVLKKPAQQKETEVKKEEDFTRPSVPPAKKETKPKKDKVMIRYFKEASKHTFLSAFSGKELEIIISKSKIRHFKPGEAVVKEGDIGDSVFIVREGSAEVVFTILGINILLATLNPGDIFGEIAFLTGSERIASVIANKNMITLELDRPLIEYMVEIKPEILEYMNETYHCRIKKTDELKTIGKDEEFLEGLKKLKH